MVDGMINGGGGGDGGMFSRAMAASRVRIRSLSSSIEEQPSTPTPASPEPEAGSGGRPEPASWRSELTPEEKSPRASLESGGPLPQSHAHSVCAWSRYVATAGTKPAHIVGCRPLPLRPPPGAKNNTSQNFVCAMSATRRRSPRVFVGLNNTIVHTLFSDGRDRPQNENAVIFLFILPLLGTAFSPVSQRRHRQRLRCINYFSHITHDQCLMAPKSSIVARIISRHPTLATH